MTKLKFSGIFTSIALAFAFLGAPSIAAADPCHSEPFTAAKQLGFTRTLLADKEYFRAAGEARRYVAFFDECGSVDSARLYSGLAYQRAGQWDNALDVFRSMADSATGPTADMATLAMADTYFRQSRFDLAAAAYGDFAAKHPTSVFSGYARYRQGFAYFLLRAPDEAERAFRQVPADAPEKTYAEKMEGVAGKASELPHRSPALAGVMSAILPGSGQVYSGRYADGVVSLFVNGVFTFAAIQAYQRDVPVVALIIALFEVGWYTGNIFSSVNYAYKFNERALEGYQRDYQQRNLVERDWSAEPGGTPVYLRFGIDFE
jgi:tetratricopeptide (TPR) repeat protein